MAISPSNNVLITLDEAKAHLEIPATNTNFDDKVQILINACSDSIANYCKRILVTNTNTEFRDGRKGNMFVLKQYPINSITSVYQDNTAQYSGEEEEVDSTEYAIDDSKTTIYFSSVAPRGFKNIRIIYESGLGTAVGDDLPWALRYACMDYVKWLYKSDNDDRIGVSSKSKAGEQVTFTLDIPDHIQTILEPFVNTDLAQADSGLYNG